MFMVHFWFYSLDKNLIFFVFLFFEFYAYSLVFSNASNLFLLILPLNLDVGNLLGLPLIPPFNSPTTTGSNILRGVNYGSAASGILWDTGLIYVRTNIPLALSLCV